MAIGSMLRPRWLPEKSFPPYAYLPGRQPHTVRDPAGHSYHVKPMPVAAEASLGSDVFLWGLDLFNHGYYWEAHEAWEGLWQVVDRGGPSRMLFKGLILLSAAGVKIREGKHAAAVRHAGRAAALLRRLMKVPELAFERMLGMSPAALAEYAEAWQHVWRRNQEGLIDPDASIEIGIRTPVPPAGRHSVVTLCSQKKASS